MRNLTRYACKCGIYLSRERIGKETVFVASDKASGAKIATIFPSTLIFHIGVCDSVFITSAFEAVRIIQDRQRG